MKVVFLVLSVVALGFLIMVAYLYLNQRNMTYYPSPLDRSQDHVKRNQLAEWSMRVGDVKLHGWLLHPDRPRLIIYYGGNGEELSWNVEEFQQLDDFAVLLVNYRGFGESEGLPSEKDLVGDALQIFDAMRPKYERVILFGRSLGSGIAVQVASQREVDRLGLVTPYDSIRAVAKRLYPWAPISLLIKDPYDSLEACRNVQVPALFLVAEFDRVVPNEHARKLADAWPGDYEWVLIEEAGHNSITSFPEYWKAIRGFLGEGLPAK